MGHAGVAVGVELLPDLPFRDTVRAAHYDTISAGLHDLQIPAFVRLDVGWAVM